MSLALEGIVAPIVDAAIRRYAISDRFEVAAIPDCGGSLQIWCPFIVDTPYQRVLDMRGSALQPWRMTRESEFGNVMFYGDYARPIAGALSFALDYIVERVPFVAMLDPSRPRPLHTTQLFARTLGSERFVDVDDKTRTLASHIVGGETNPLHQARRVYEYVTEAMRYDAAQQSWRGSTEHALVCSVGNCNDIHALFVSLCRSIGIPARFVLGQALEAPPQGQETCDLCGYHFRPGAIERFNAPYDKEMYKARHLMENFYCKLKQFRAIATRYDKTARNFLAGIHLAAAVIWLN